MTLGCGRKLRGTARKHRLTIRRLRGFCRNRVQMMVQIIGCADQSQMSECLWKITEMLAAWPQFFGEKADVIGITQSLFEEEAGLFQIPASRQAFDVPERADRKR